MCGFLVVLNSKVNKDELVNKFNQLKKLNIHRGPDEIKTLHKKNYSILFRRLEIIDLNKRSSQPFSSDDGQIDIVFNGEIYNYLEIKNELKKFNIKFRTKSDTEVILKSYQKWGESFVKKLRGMFSIIILDNKRNKYLCFRDRLGQKPLFYTNYGNGLIFGSEIKDILFFKSKNEIKENKKTVLKYLLRGWCDDSHHTFFNNIYSVPSSKMGIIKKFEIRFKRYWKLEITGSKTFDKDEFNQIFLENLKIHLRSDVPIAFTLSGGFDSSSIVKKSIDLNFSKYKAFSLFSSNNKENFEKKFINQFIKENSIDHLFVDLDKKNKKDILEKVIFFQDEPLSSMSFLNQYILRKEIKNEGYKVLMVGEGGDEVLAGYNRMFIPFLYSSFIKKKIEIPENIKKNISLNLGKNFKFIKKHLKNFIKHDDDIEDKSPLKFLNLKKGKVPLNLRFYNSIKPSNDNLFKSFLTNHIFKRDLPHILRQEDRISMSQSIENRTPFVDHKLIEYVFSINEKFFMQNGQSKYMLRSIMKNDLPKSFFSKKKIGRPGNPSNIIFNEYFDKLLEFLKDKSFNNEYFESSILKKTLTNDKKYNNLDNINFYFRVLNYFIWKNLYKVS